MGTAPHRTRMPPLWIFALSGCAGSPGALRDGERCEDVPEAVPGEIPEGPALVCADAPEVEGNTCPNAWRAEVYLDELLDETLGVSPCGWSGHVTCGPSLSEPDRCCYVVEGATRLGCD